MTPAEAHRLELLITEGFATIRGDINLLARAEHENGQDIEKLDTRVGNLEVRRFPLPTIGGIMGVLAVCVSVISLVSGKG